MSGGHGAGRDPLCICGAHPVPTETLEEVDRLCYYHCSSWLVPSFLGVVVLFVTDIFLGKLEKGVRLVETHRSRTSAVRGLRI
jgi:hypothetical protein